MSNWITPGQGPFFPSATDLSPRVKLYQVANPSEFDRVVFFSQAYSEQRDDTHQTAVLAYISAAPLVQINPELPWDAASAAYNSQVYQHILSLSESLQKNVILIHATVDPFTFHLGDNPYKSNPKLQIRQLPTLLRWQTSDFTDRLVGEAVTDPLLVRTLISNGSEKQAGVTWYKHNSATASSINDLDRLLSDVSYNHSIDFQKTPVLLWSVLEADAQTGESQCPDVRKATPVLHSALQSINQHTVIVQIEVARSDWSKPAADNAYKQHPALQLTKVPTLQRYWQGNTVGWSLVEGATFDGEHIAELVRENLPSNRTVYYKVQREEKPADFEKLVKTVESHNKRNTPVLVYAVSAKEKDLGDGHLVPWCPYVRLGSPVFHRTLAQSGQQHIVIIVDVALDGYRDEKVNLWRAYQPLLLQFVPTLYRWEGTGKQVQRALVGAALTDVKKLKEILQPYGPPIYWHRVLENELYVNLNDPKDPRNYKWGKHNVDRFNFLVNGAESRIPTLLRTQKDGSPLLVHAVLPPGYQQDSWCPYVQASNPVLKRALSVLNQRVHIVEVEIPSAYYKDLNTDKGGGAYRHNVLQLDFVPTLYRWSVQTGKPEAQLVARSVQDVALIDDLLSRSGEVGPTYWKVLNQDTGKLSPELVLKIAVDRLALRSNGKPTLVYLTQSKQAQKSEAKASTGSIQHFIDSSKVLPPNAESSQLYKALHGKDVVVIQVDVPEADAERWKSHPLLHTTQIPSLHLLYLPVRVGEIAKGNAQAYPGRLVNQPTAEAAVIASATNFDQSSVDKLLSQHQIQAPTQANGTDKYADEEKRGETPTINGVATH